MEGVCSLWWVSFGHLYMVEYSVSKVCVRSGEYHVGHLYIIEYSVSNVCVRSSEYHLVIYI